MSSDINTLLQVKDLCKSYEIYDYPWKRLLQTIFMGHKTFYTSFTALNNVSFELKRGECLGVIGGNGAGKSTLLALLAGTLRATSGSIEKHGRVCALQELGFGFNPEFTGRENIRVAGLMLGLTAAQVAEREESIITFADIGTFIDQPVKKYSSGMFVRLAFGLIAHTDSDIMLIDEALAVGDVFFQQKCHRYIEEKKKNSAMVLVSHDMSAIANLCDRVIVLEQGHVAFCGAPKEAIEYYTHLLYKQPELPVETVQQEKELPEEWQLIDEKHKTGQYGQFTAFSLSRSVLSEGDVLRISARIELNQSCQHPIIGYFFNDRFGKRIFGNCVLETTAVEPGILEFSFELTWPDIAPGEYTLTLGLGSGDDIMTQTVYCWTTDFCAVTSLKENGIVHGVFNIAMNNFTYKGTSK